MKALSHIFFAVGVMLATAAPAPGQQTLRFDGAGFASGVYFVRVVARADGGENIVRLKKMTLIK